MTGPVRNERGTMLRYNDYNLVTEKRKFRSCSVPWRLSYFIIILRLLNFDLINGNMEPQKKIIIYIAPNGI